MKKKSNYGLIRHYLIVDAICGRQFLDNDCSSDEYCATSRATTVAMHYLQEDSTFEEFRNAIHAPTGSSPRSHRRGA